MRNYAKLVFTLICFPSLKWDNLPYQLTISLTVKDFYRRKPFTYYGFICLNTKDIYIV